jgi:cell division protein FtsA
VSSALSVLDFGPDKVIALIGARRPDAAFDILGAGDARARGVGDGEITRLGDAVESVVEAVRKAERAARLKIKKIYFNFDDPLMESVYSKASKPLAGEGEIERADVEEVCALAERMVARFERSVVYSKPLDFLIDERDAVENPVGVFGRKLGVTSHILRARSERLEVWQKLVERAHLEKGVPVLSAWSTAYGVLRPEDRKRGRLIADVGSDFMNFFIFENNRIARFKTLSPAKLETGDWTVKAIEASRELAETHDGVEEVLVTGDRAEEDRCEKAFREAFGERFRVAPPLGVSILASPRFSSAAGLLRVAAELEKKAPSLSKEKGFITGVKEKAKEFIDEYF